MITGLGFPAGDLFLAVIGACIVVCFLAVSAIGRRRLAGPRSAMVDPVGPKPKADGWLPLVACARDDRACLRCLDVDRCLLHRLNELGLTAGVELRVVQDTGGPMLVSVRGSRVALGRELAEKLWVEVTPHASDM